MPNIIRGDFPKGLNADLHKWYWEGDDPNLKKVAAFVDDLADIKPLSQIKGSYWQGTSAVVDESLADVDDYGTIQGSTPQEGFTVYARIKQKGREIVVPREHDRDWFRAATFLKSYMRANGKRMVENAKRDIVLAFYDYGGYNAGHEATFNNNIAELSLTTYTSPNVIYDNESWFGGAHVNKAGTSFSNIESDTSEGAFTGLANGVNAEVAATMWNKLTATNAKKENGDSFDNDENVMVLTHSKNRLDWDAVMDSMKNPDNNNNTKNTMADKLSKVISTNKLATDTQSVMFRKNGLKVWFGEPRITFYNKYNPNQKVAQIMLDYAACVYNWRFAVSNNAPTS